MTDFVTLTREQKVDLFDKVLAVNENSESVVFMRHSPHVDVDIAISVFTGGWESDKSPDVEFMVCGYVDCDYSIDQSVSYDEACQRLMNLL